VEYFVACCVIRPDWNELTGFERILLQSPYKLCAQWLLGASARWIKRKRKKDKVAVVCEQGAGWEGSLIEGYQSAKKRLPWVTNYLHSLAFSEKDQTPELQAADIFAYEVRKAVLSIGGFENREIRKSMQELVKFKKFGIHVWHKDNLLEHLDEFVEVAASSPELSDEEKRALFSKARPPQLDTSTSKLRELRNKFPPK